jgi:peptidoglycan/LPS O-acetylase OafA/YrhL
MTVMLLCHAEFPWAQGAFLGLSQFFTLSGFLVTAVLLQGVDRDGRVDLRRFWTRRIR